MWKTLLSEEIEDWEPQALRSLKRKLLNVNCKCRSCQKYRSSVALANLPEEDLDTQECIDVAVKENKSVEVQAGPGIVEELSDQRLTSQECLQQYWANLFHKELMCPSCINTLGFLRGGMTRVVKDEEIATKNVNFTSDKSTSQTILYLEKTTSLTFKPVLKYSNSVVSEIVNQVTSVDSLSYPYSHREVTFAFKNNYYSDDDINDLTDQLLETVTESDRASRLPNELDLALEPITQYLQLDYFH